MSSPLSSASSRPPLADAVQELGQLLLDTDSFHQLMVTIAALIVRTVPGAMTCGVTMANDGRVITVGAADDLAMQLDEQQYELDEGPCLQALREGHIVDAPDLTTEHRWDDYPEQAIE